LASAVIATYAGALGFDFVRYDDPDYVLDNPHVRGGWTWAGVRWAFTSTHASNWHPLTWLAHMLDVELFGLNPAGHHAASVVWHGLAAGLCYWALRALTARPWPSAFVAALFALHPLRVESVAWISERKDVLAGAAFFSTLGCYARWARGPSVGRALAVAASFALGLLAKPMLVTLPCLLLLLDVWPLARGTGWRALRARVLEKAPLFLLSVLASALTLHAQRSGGALQSLSTLSFEARCANAPLALLRYLAHTFWPLELSYFYPHAYFVEPARAGWNAAALGALLFVLAASAGALALRRRAPAVALGWFWFLGLCVPVLGLVQVGEQALADRYTYLPSVGLAVAFVFPAADALRTRPRLLCAALVASLGFLLTLGTLSARQARVWRNSYTLFDHALALDARNYAAWSARANLFAEAGDVARARADYERALAIVPSYAPALYSLGLLEQEHGDRRRALELYRAALRSQPAFLAAELNLGSVLAQEGASVEAAEAFERVLALDPRNPKAHLNLGLLLLGGAAPREAEEHLRAALESEPELGRAWEALAAAHAAQGHFERAVETQTRALECLDPLHAAEARQRLERYRAELSPR
jgi:tetratricopeptide (TPR) repeat protein